MKIKSGLFDSYKEFESLIDLLINYQESLKYVYQLEGLLQEFREKPIRHLLSKNGIKETLDDLNKKMTSIIDNYFVDIHHRSALEVARDWFKRINKNYFQGGYGYSFYWSDKHDITNNQSCPCHWVVKEDKYEESLPSDLEKLACKTLGFEYSLAKGCASERWGN